MIFRYSPLTLCLLLTAPNVLHSQDPRQPGQDRFFCWNWVEPSPKIEWRQVGNEIETFRPNIGHGLAMSADGNRVVFGEPILGDAWWAGRAYVFEWNSTSWVQVGETIEEDPYGDRRMGLALGMSADGNRVAIGGKFHIFVYDWNSHGNNTWDLVGNRIERYVNRSTSEHWYFIDMSADGNRIAYGDAQFDQGYLDNGFARVVEYNSTDWVPMGQTIYGITQFDYLGTAVALSASGGRFAVGAHAPEPNGWYVPNPPPNLTNIGYVQVYDWNGTYWTPVGRAFHGDASLDWFGVMISLSSDGSRIAIGAAGNYGAEGYAGRVRIYEWKESDTGKEWVQMGDDIEGELPGDAAAVVALSGEGNRLAVGAQLSEADGFANETGQLRVFEWNGTSWNKVGSNINGVKAGQMFGFPIAISDDGSRVAAGAYTDIRVFDAWEVREE